MLEKQSIRMPPVDAVQGHAWVDAYDMLERNWPYSRAHHEPPSLIKAAARIVTRRQRSPMPSRRAYQSTAEYHDAILPLLVARTYWEQVTAWRYVRPMMITVLLRHLSRPSFYT